MSQTINLQNVPLSKVSSNTNQQPSLSQIPTGLASAVMSSTNPQETECVSKPQQLGKVSQQRQGFSLGEMSQSRKREADYEPSEQDFEMAIRRHMNSMGQIDLSSFHGICKDSLPNRAILMIKMFANKFWQANRPQQVGDNTGKQKALLLTYLLDAVFQIGMKSVQELISQKEKELCGLTVMQLGKYIGRLVNKITAQLIGKKGEKDDWKLLLQHVQQHFAFRREVLGCKEIKLTIQRLKEKINNERKDPQGNQPNCEQYTLNHLIQSKCQKMYEKLLNDPQIIKESNDQTHLCQKSHDNEQPLPYCQEKVSINNDFSIMTEGVVTDIDISLPFPDDKEADAAEVPQTPPVI